MSPWTRYRLRRRLFGLCHRSWPAVRALLTLWERPQLEYVNPDDHERKRLIRDAEYQARADAEVRILRLSSKPLPKGRSITAPVERVQWCRTPGCPLQFSHGGRCVDARD